MDTAAGLFRALMVATIDEAILIGLYSGLLWHFERYDGLYLFTVNMLNHFWYEGSETYFRLSPICY